MRTMGLSKEILFLASVLLGITSTTSGLPITARGLVARNGIGNTHTTENPVETRDDSGYIKSRVDDEYGVFQKRSSRTAAPKKAVVAKKGAIPKKTAVPKKAAIPKKLVVPKKPVVPKKAAVPKKPAQKKPAVPKKPTVISQGKVNVGSQRTAQSKGSTNGKVSMCRRMSDNSGNPPTSCTITPGFKVGGDSKFDTLEEGKLVPGAKPNPAPEPAPQPAASGSSSFVVKGGFGKLKEGQSVPTSKTPTPVPAPAPAPAPASASAPAPATDSSESAKAEEKKMKNLKLVIGNGKEAQDKRLELGILNLYSQNE
ncbi:unnamed protein product [Clonostachys rosea f. rosea IK726]|uniref:Uncharacterized protein n=1 Tax=Clonostachys rosea f. rosea IK726 TaxID=1349383 RepID=A0ACA9TKW0_BIOOC|nr:unnamed protein product [Clonostachys rosea f. rosea IK726]